MTCGGEGKERLVTSYQAIRLITTYKTEFHLDTYT